MCGSAGIGRGADAYNAPSFYGAFGKGPLKREQMRLVALANQDKSTLCTVPDIPDADEIPAILSLIASRITARALAIIDGRDRALGVLVTATSDKTLDDLTRALSTDLATGSRELIWIQMGTEENGLKTKARERIDHTIDRIRQASRSPDAFRQARQTLLDGRSTIDAARRQHLAMRAQIDALLAKAGCSSDEGLGDIQAQCSQTLASTREQLSKAGITDPAIDNDQLLALVSAFERTHQAFTGDSLPPGVTLAAAVAVAASPQAATALQAVTATYPCRQPAKLLAATVYRPYWRRVLNTVVEGLPPGPARDVLARIPPSQAAALGARIAQVSAAGPIVFEGLVRSDADALEAFLQATKAIADARARRARAAQAEKAIGMLDPESRQLAQQSASQSWLAHLNARFTAHQRTMLEAACTLLYEYALVHRDEVILALEAFAAHMDGKAASDASSEDWVGRPGELARMVSMVYPVVVAPIESAPSLSLLSPSTMADQSSYELVLILGAATASTATIDHALALGARGIVMKP